MVLTGYKFLLLAAVTELPTTWKVGFDTDHICRPWLQMLTNYFIGCQLLNVL